MDGIEAIKAMMEGKTVEVIHGCEAVVTGMTYKFNDMGELVRSESGHRSTARMNDFLASKFEIVPEYPLDFFEAMEALNEGKKVMNERYSCIVYKKNEQGIIVYNDDDVETPGIGSTEIAAKWRIVEE